MEEAPFYHCIALTLDNDYRRIAAVKIGRTWKEAWETIAPATKAHPDDEWEKFKKHGVRLILREDPDFPELLKEIPFSPFGIYVRGKIPAAPCSVAIVGTRKATEGGKTTAKKIAGELARAGCLIVSGLALGIDAAAHRGALEAGGKTIAVLANGVDAPYPRMNADLAKKILECGGGLISEYPPGAPSLPYRFLERNRIISGLSRGVAVIEAPRQSGSLATARFATEQNREVFVIPGPAAHPNFAGSHALIRQGAELITEAGHILEALGITPALNSLTANAETPEEALVIRALKESQIPLSIDKIIELTNLKTNVASRTVSFLTIKNIIRESGTGYTI